MTVPWNFTLNVNLEEGAVLQLDLLQEVANHSALDDDKVLKHSIFRYENYWLPLAGKHPNEALAAPLDVEWIWLCHMLSPVDYQRDCNLLVGRVVSHKLYSAMQRRKFQQKARSLWQVEYPQEPFHIELDADLYFTDDHLRSRLSCDLLAAAARQKVFFYQVRLPHFKDPQFLSTCELRYKRFLFLKQQNRDLDLVPSYDIDLIWHTHMLHPLAYKIDTETILGYTLAHHKSLDEADANLHLSEAFVETRELWRRAFDVNFEVCGSTYRGEPTAGKLHALTAQQNFMASTKTATFIIEKVDVQGLPALKGKLVFKLYTGLNGKIGKCAATFKGEPPWQGKAVPDTDFETETVNYLKIRVLDQTGMLACLGTREIVGEKDIDLRPTLDSLTHETSVEHSVSLSQVYGATVAQVTTHFCWPQRGPVHLYLRVGIFTQSLVPEKAESVFCHVPIRKMPTGIENATYLTASHSFVNHSESVVLTCRVLHSVDLLQSAVHVFFQDKMAAVAHLVGLDQLPLPTQISDPRKVPYLNPRAGERGVLIKNHSGDWAVVIGRWTAVRKGGSRMGSRRGKDGLPGHLMIRIRELADFGWRELQLTYSDQLWHFTLDDLHADLKEGTIRIDNPDSQHIAEKVALTFGVALLHVLCMPRPSGWKRGTSLRPRTSRRGTRSSKWIPSDEMPFILAAGVMQETPTNGYIRQTHGISAWTSEREALLGPANTDLLSCRPEDGLGGMWAHVTPGLNELFVQGSLVVPDGNSSCSMQHIADGNSSISAQIFPDGSSSCSQIFIDGSACASSSAMQESQSASEKKAESDVKLGLSTLTVPGGKPTVSSLTIPDGNSPGFSTAVVPDGKSSASGFVDNSGADKKPEVLSPASVDGQTRSDAQSGSDAMLGSSSPIIRSPSSGMSLPGENSLGISALAMLGGKLSSAHASSTKTLPRIVPSVNVDTSLPCTTNHVPALEDSTLDAAAASEGLKISIETAVQDATLEDESAENQCLAERSVEGESAGEGSVEDQLSSSSSSLQAMGEINLIPSMLGVPGIISEFQSGRLSPRDMIDICEERIYSDYRCSVETGGVDDLITNDTKFDQADEEIIVAVQSRRNSRRKDAPSKAKPGANRGSTAAAESSEASDRDDFAASLSAALAASLGDSDQNKVGSSSSVKGKGISDRAQSDACNSGENVNGVSSEDS